MILDLFSRRQKQLDDAGKPDVYSYDVIPAPLRVQVQQILKDALGPHYQRSGYSADHYINDNPDTWIFIAKALRKEFGVHRLARAVTEGEEVVAFLEEADTSQFIDTVELCVRVLDRVAGEWPEYQRKQKGIEQEAEAAIEEINFRFRQAGVGFQFVDGIAVRLDSEYAHEEVVRPALLLLRNSQYTGPQEEFLRAHRHYRNAEYPQAITESAKAFESMLKAVCDTKGWSYEKGSRASDLLKRVRAEGLWPDYLDASFDQLLATLGSGLPKVRNEDGAHGQGRVSRATPAYIAAYALHLAAAKIVLIGEAATAAD